MKQLFAGVVIIFVIGLGSFLYRNTMERPGIVAPEVACTLEAKLCPDGSAVGRSGPSCAFAPCAFPNIEIPGAGIAFMLPEGYAADESAYGADTRVLAAFVKPSVSGNPQHTIVVYRYTIAEGETAEDVILENTRFQPADEQASTLDQFDRRTVGERVFYRAHIERFEALIHTSYFLPREKDVLRFDLVEHDVTEWTNPALFIEGLPEHAGFLRLLASLQASS